MPVSYQNPSTSLNSIKSLIDNQHTINVYLIEDHKAQEVVQTIEAYGVTRHRGPGIVVKYAMSDEGGLSSLWLIEIWGKLKLYAVVLPGQNLDYHIT